MKTLLSIPLLTLCLLAGSGLLRAQAFDLNAELRRLDEVISRKESFFESKEESIRLLKRRLATAATAEEQYRLADTIFESYLHFQTDSALQYIHHRTALLPRLHNPAYTQRTHIDHALLLGVMGIYDSALNLLRGIDAADLQGEELIAYYQTYCACYGWMSDYIGLKSGGADLWQLTDAYRDSTIQVMPPGVSRIIAQAEGCIAARQPDAALQRLNEAVAAQPDMRQMVYIYFTYSEVYRLLGNEEQTLHYLIQTAQLDLRSGIREYASLQKLAMMMYQRGDLDRAYRYLNCSMEDAVSCNARLRFIEVTQFFPIIDRAYKLKEQRERSVVRIMLLSTGALSLFLIIAVFYLVRWMRKLSAMRRDLSVANDRLRQVNLALEETGKVKEVYIARYLDRCINYLDKLEAYRRMLAKLAAASRIDDLFRAIKSEQFLIDEREAFYREFDQSFLALYPNFIIAFNELLTDEGKIYLRPGELLTPELRIFALVRLGVTDSQQIAHFLSFSLVTVYNYRSRVRNRAVDKEHFEQLVLTL